MMVLLEDRYLIEALEQARLAYEFAPGSYTYSAFAALLTVSGKQLPADNWITETLNWIERDE